jgi:tripartite-type tricarboxylate transporter receptor subunit TctC
MPRLYGFGIALAAWVAAGTAAFAQDAAKYPEQMVRLIVPFSAGSMTDLLARTVAEKLSERWKQQVIVENRPGLAGTSSVAKATADGYTLMLTSNGHTVIGNLNKNLSFDPQKDFVGISQVATTPLILVAPPESATKSVKELIAAAKAKPGALNYGHPGNATIPHLAMIEFARLAKVEFNQVPFKGPAEAIQMTHAGQIDFAAVPLSAAATSGLRMPALFAPARNPAIPDVPTMKEQGFDVAPLSFGALVGPVGLPADVKRKLGDACRAAAHTDAYLRVTKNAFQPSDYYGDSATLESNLEKDVAEKKRLLGALGLLK